MELLDYQDRTIFTHRSFAESDEENLVMSSYFQSHGSDNDSCYTNDTEYDFKPQLGQYSYGTTAFEEQSAPGPIDYQYYSPMQQKMAPQQITQTNPSQSQNILSVPSQPLDQAVTLSRAPLNFTNIHHTTTIPNLSPIVPTTEEKKNMYYSPRQIQHPQIGPQSLNLQGYPDMTTMVNSNQNLVLPKVDAAFVDLSTCSICNKRINRDMTRHMRTHQLIPRFQCPFPKSQCNHKSGRFNRPYDFKKHLLNRHFKFDNTAIKRLHTLSDKLDHGGICPCGARFIGRDWLDYHILTQDHTKKCACIKY